jgi:hypothetical protein
MYAMRAKNFVREIKRLCLYSPMESASQLVFYGLIDVVTTTRVDFSVK